MSPDQELFNWTERMHSAVRGTLGDLCRQQSVALALSTLIAYFKERPPERLVSDIYDIEQYLRAISPELYYEATKSGVAAGVSSGKILLDVHVDDTVKLRANTTSGLPLLTKCGQWWKILKGTSDRWYLRSLTRKEQGLDKISNHTFDYLWIEKQNDPVYTIVKVVPFPTEFNHKEHN